MARPLLVTRSQYPWKSRPAGASILVAPFSARVAASAVRTPGSAFDRFSLAATSSPLEKAANGAFLWLMSARGLPGRAREFTRSAVDLCPRL